MSLIPRSVGELQLYRVLQRANLLSYYAAFVQQGGDDVQQLCEAAEEEFLEIMSLVGMATKPLHVRRLQKALRDWVTNPTLFDQPLTSLPACSIPVFKLQEEPQTGTSVGQKSPLLEPGTWSVSPCGLGDGSGSPVSESPSPTYSGSPCWSGEPTEAIEPGMRRCVSECVQILASTLPRSNPAEVKGRLRGNKKLSRTISRLCDLREDDPQREEEIRKYSAIYGRFDSKRRDGRPLTTHELVVNEAAAQLCLWDAGLLTHRDQLFSLARNISREVTYRHIFKNRPGGEEEEELVSPKRIKMEEGVYGLQDSLYLLHMQQKALRERLACVKTQGEESITQALQMQLDSALQDTAVHPHNIQTPALRFSDSRTSHTPVSANQSVGLYVIGRNESKGEIPLGRQLANELKQHHKHRHKQNSEWNSETDTTEKTENWMSQRELCPVDYTKVKSEPEESR
ncbi:NGFI-A-binding protein 1-like isoform X1 [Hoplias malabaricus]|uniref:NGFI-A-binding protein 1-like isoform X1 n=1 Tax=Hoplias malabaricus TaxID=27720 RepID=UPI003463696B